MPKEIFALLLCSCGHGFVRECHVDSDWVCPSCNLKTAFDSAMEVNGPARDLSRLELNEFIGVA